MKDVKTVIAQLLKEGAEMKKGLKVYNVNTKDLSKYTRLSLTLDKNVKQYVDGGNGAYIMGENNIIFVSAFSIGAIIGTMEVAAFAKNILMQQPKMLEMLLSFADIDILLEEVKEGQEYVNPFASNATSVVVAHDSVYVHIIGIRIGSIGHEILQELKKRMIEENLKKAFANASIEIPTTEG